MDDSAPTQRMNKQGPMRLLIAALFFGAVVVIAALLYFFSLNSAPAGFPVGETIIIEEGSSIYEAVSTLSDKDVIRSRLYVQFLLRTNFDDAFVRPGAYTFPEELSAHAIAEAITSGEYSTPHNENILTFPEGFQIKNILEYLPEKYDDIDLTALEEHEGYLFPDTYFIKTDDTIEDIVQLMRTNFEARISSFREEIDTARYSLHEIITLASILEREGNTDRSMRIIAGILLKRLEEGMPLQVDAAFEYILGKTSAELTEDDLELNSPYNTYTNPGLPPTPISNPGLVAIRAVLNPIETDYYYYLSDNDGNFHYAQDFEGHKDNKFEYLQ